MFAAVIITFVITTQTMLVLWLLSNAKKHGSENDRLHKSYDRLNGKVTEMIRQDHLQKERDAYNRGLYDGRSTDALYRKLLSKYTAGEQATVMMYGESKIGENEDE